jgi:hypothetical protein
MIDIYGLGTACFFLLYSIQSSNAFGNAIFCISFLVVASINFFTENKLSTLGFKDHYDVLLFMPALLLVHVICVSMLLWYAIPTALDDGWYLLPNTIMSASAPFMTVNREFPRNITETLWTCLPITVLISLCCISFTIAQPPTECSWQLFFTSEGDILWYNIAVTLVLPLPGALTVHSLITACNKDKIVDIATIILLLACIKLLETPIPAILSSTALFSVLLTRTYQLYITAAT